MKASSVLLISAFGVCSCYIITDKPEAIIVAAILVVGAAIVQQLEKLSK
jgi:hypothetical protein